MIKHFRTLAAMLALCAAPLAAHNHPSAGHWGVFAEFLYITPSVDDTYFVLNSPITTDFPNGVRENNDAKYHPGVRVGAIYAGCECDTQFKVSYARLGMSEDKVVAGDFLWATMGRAELTSAFEDYTGVASSDLEYVYNRGDVLVQQKILDCCGLDAYIVWGIEYADFRLNEDYFYDDGVTLGEVHQRSKSYGVGPQLGFDLDYAIWDSECFCNAILGLTVSSTGSLLVAKTDTMNQNTLTGSGYILDVVDKDTWRVIPAFHMNAGVNLDFSMLCLDFSVELGYEVNTYIRGLTRTSFSDDVADGFVTTTYYNYDIHGPYFSGSITF